MKIAVGSILHVRWQSDVTALIRAHGTFPDGVNGALELSGQGGEGVVSDGAVEHWRCCGEFRGGHDVQRFVRVELLRV